MSIFSRKALVQRSKREPSRTHLAPSLPSKEGAVRLAGRCIVVEDAEALERIAEDAA